MPTTPDWKPFSKPGVPTDGLRSHDMGYNILIVDDTDFLQMLFDELMTAGVTGTIAEAGNHYEAMSFLGSLEPELVAIDVDHPGLDSYDLIREIRTVSPDVHIVAIRSADSPSNPTQAMSAGANNVIIKPYDRREIEDVLNIILKRFSTCI